MDVDAYPMALVVIDRNIDGAEVEDVAVGSAPSPSADSVVGTYSSQCDLLVACVQ